MIIHKPSEKEEEFFMQEELKRRKALQKERLDKIAEAERAKLRELHWLHCPKCGMEMEEIQFKGVQVDKCLSCGGVYLDAGEMETILAIEDSSLMKKFFKIFS